MFLTLSCSSCLFVLRHTKEAPTVETSDKWHVECFPKSQDHVDSHDRGNRPVHLAQSDTHPLPIARREHAEVPFAPLLLLSELNARSKHVPVSPDNRPRPAIK